MTHMSPQRSLGTAHLASATAPLAILVALCVYVGTAKAHEHHMNNIVEGQGISDDPIDTTLWIHIMIQITAWGILFPTGMVLGLVRSRWHVPVQITGSALALVGYFLGHAHKGRQFAPNAHAGFAPFLNFFLIGQIALGIYLRLHWEKGIHGRIRRFAVVGHGIVGVLLPVASWVQFLLGGIALLGFCRDDHLGQCLAHFIMGSAFIAYGIILTILLLVGQAWLRRTGRSQEFFDSAVIAAWGCVNTFTEHRWGSAWVHNDLQHTSMGIIWWCAGLLGMWLSRSRNGAPRRNLVPALVIILTGYAMSSHPQSLMISTMTHSIFGYTLISAGIARLVEISFVLKDQPNISEDGTSPSSFQFLPPFLLCASGFLFMGATEEQMKLLSESGVDAVTYVLLLYSVSFLLYLFINLLINLYASHAMPVAFNKYDPEANGANGANGHLSNGHPRSGTEDFELEGLMSGDEDDSIDETEQLVKEAGRVSDSS